MEKFEMIKVQIQIHTLIQIHIQLYLSSIRIEIQQREQIEMKNIYKIQIHIQFFLLPIRIEKQQREQFEMNKVNPFSLGFCIEQFNSEKSGSQNM